MSELRVVLVEDNEDHALLVRMLLEGAGAAVEVCPDGAAALERLARPPAPDVLLVDLRLPRISGFEVLRRSRALPGMALVAISTSEREDDRAAAAAAGAQAYVRKGEDLVRLEHDLRDVLGRVLPAPEE